MENNKNMRLDNKYVNKILKEYSQSDAIGFKIDAFKQPVNGGSTANTPAVDAMYEGTSQEYADLTGDLKSGKLSGDEGMIAQNRLRSLEGAPATTKNFLENLYSVFDGTEEKHYDPNNNYEWALLNKIFKGAPGFGENQGYSIEMGINEDGSQNLTAYGKPFSDGKFVVNSQSLNDMLEILNILDKELSMNNEQLFKVVNTTKELLDKMYFSCQKNYILAICCMIYSYIKDDKNQKELLTSLEEL